MKKFIVVLLVLGLTACADSKKDDKGPLSGGSNQNEKVENVTDYGACGQYTPRTIEGAWVMYQRSGQFNFTMTFDIYNGYITLTNECEFQGRTLTATVSAPAYYNSSMLETLGEGYDEQRINDGGLNMTCDVSMKKSRLRYRFHGGCLELSEAGSSQKLLLLPR